MVSTHGLHLHECGFESRPGYGSIHTSVGFISIHSVEVAGPKGRRASPAYALLPTRSQSGLSTRGLFPPRVGFDSLCELGGWRRK